MVWGQKIATNGCVSTIATKNSFVIIWLDVEIARVSQGDLSNKRQCHGTELCLAETSCRLLLSTKNGV